MREQLDRFEADQSVMMEVWLHIREELRRTNEERSRLSARQELTELRSPRKGAAYKPQPNDTWDTLKY